MKNSSLHYKAVSGALGVWFALLAFSLVRPATAQVGSPVDLTDSLRAFGQQKYREAREGLEKVSKKSPSMTPMLYYYLGECYYQLKDYAKAEELLRKAMETPYNRQEACWRLWKIAEESGDQTKASSHEQRLAKMSEDAAHDFPRSRKGEAIPMIHGPPMGVSHAESFLINRRFEDAARAFEYGLDVNVKPGERFTNAYAIIIYDRLADTYRKCVDLLRSRKAKELEIEQAVLMARYYSLKKLVAIERIGPDWKQKLPQYR